MDFKCLHWREKKAQEFDKEKIFIEKAGVKYNMYDLIQTERDDTEVIPTLEKYGCIDRMITNIPDIYANFEKMKNLRDYKEQEITANNMWDNLSLDIRSQFNNDKYNFMKNGENWLKNKVEEINKQNKPQEQKELPLTEGEN